MEEKTMDEESKAHIKDMESFNNFQKECEKVTNISRYLNNNLNKKQLNLLIEDLKFYVQKKGF